MNDEAAKCMHLVMIIITQTSHKFKKFILIINGNAIFSYSNLSIIYVSEIFFVFSSSLIYFLIHSVVIDSFINTRKNMRKFKKRNSRSLLPLFVFDLNEKNYAAAVFYILNANLSLELEISNNFHYIAMNSLVLVMARHF